MYIIEPKTHEKVNLFSLKGKKILLKYVKHYIGGNKKRKIIPVIPCEDKIESSNIDDRIKKLLKENCLDNVTIEKKKLGAGGGGQVYKGTYMNNDIIAKESLDVLMCNNLEDERCNHGFKKFMDEFLIMNALKGKDNIIKTMGLYVGSQDNVHDEYEIEKYKIYIIMEACEQSLSNLLKQNVMDNILEYAKQIANGIKNMHDNNYVHLDLKPDNILICGMDKVCKLIDFGNSLHRDKISGQFNYIDDDNPKLSGTPGFVPPERYKNNPGTTINENKIETFEELKQWDIYSFGKIIIDHLIQKVPLQSPEYNSLKELAKKCCGETPSKRPTIDDIINTLNEDLEQTILL